MKMNLKVQVALHLICTRITLCYVIQVLNSALIHAALIDSLKLLLRGGEGGLLPGDGGRGTRIMVNNNYS